MKTLVFVGIAIVAGIAVTLQGQFMGTMDRHLGTRESVFLTYASGGLLATLIMVTKGSGSPASWTRLPWYVYTSGLLGLIIVGAIGWTVSRLGAAKAFTLIVASQFVVAALIDHFGLFLAETRPIDPARAGGLGLLLAGVWLVVK